jgi:hypothetical protein
MTRTLASEWATFRERVVPAGAGPTEVKERRRTFYAGAASLFLLVTTEMDPGEEPTEADLARMDAIHRELKAFKEDIERGLA